VQLFVRWVDAAAGVAAVAGGLAGSDLPSIIGRLAAERGPGEVVIASEANCAQSGTVGCAARVRLGREPVSGDCGR
jgi:hypothetical protein